MYKFLTLLILIIFINSSCSKKDLNTPKLEKASIDEQMTKTYNEGLEALYPQSIWAPRSALMTAYSYYEASLYQDTIDELNRYLKTYPFHDRKNYAYYLMGLSYYEQIVDEKKDLNPIIKSKEYFQLVAKDYPNSEFAVDAEYKLELIQEILASKEMY